ncbi:MAG: hypothetical protein JW838_04100 [Spirochaetes bacterium]|nr:hypothetical protein [Spirochaetota bacterium]
MKIQCLIRTLLLSIALIFPASTFASVSISVGGNVWYAWWQPAWSDGKMLINTILPVIGGVVSSKVNSKNFTPSGSVLAGPSLSIGFLKRWSISSVFLAGKYLHRSSGLAPFEDVWSSMLFSLTSLNFGVSHQTYTRRSVKMESDTTVSCSLHRYVKLFTGFKYQGYAYDEEFKEVRTTDASYRELRDEVKQYGAGIGLGGTLPLGANFFLLASTSGIALWGFETTTFSTQYCISFPWPPAYTLTLAWKGKGRFFSYGCSTSLSVAYYIARIGTTVSIGGRYQVLFYRQKYHDIFRNDVAMNIVNGKYDHFYGVTFSMTYSFRIGGKSKGDESPG